MKSAGVKTFLAVGLSQTVQGVMDVRLESVMSDEGQPSGVSRSLESHSEMDGRQRAEAHGLICGGLTARVFSGK